MKLSKLPYSIIEAITITILIFSLIPNLQAPIEAAVIPGYNGKIVFESNIGSQWEIFSADADGSNRVNLTNAIGSDENPSWSPDGQKILFHSYRTGNADIFIMDPDGSNQTNLTNIAGSDLNPTWSPDGSKIAFASTRDGNSEIYVMDADGSNQTRLTNATSTDRNPTWSPDSTKIAFDTNRGGNWNVYSINSDGTNETNLANNTAYDSLPSWSPDGSSITFTSDRDGNSEIYKMDADGSNQTRLTNTSDRNESYPAYSLDGLSIAFARYDLAWDSAILAVISDDGTSAQEYDVSSDGVVVIDEISWTPDNKHVLFNGYHDQWYDLRDIYMVEKVSGAVSQLTADDSSSRGDFQSIINTAPSTTTDNLTTSYNTAGTADVLVNDTDEEALDGQYLTITVQPLNGTASVVDGKVKYTPNDGFKGADSLTYQICDSFQLDQKCATGVLAITAQAPGAPALAVSKIDGIDFNSTTNKYSTTNARPTFNGTASPGSTVKVEIHSDPILLTTTADSSGNWSVTPTADLPIGDHEVFISATLNGVTTELDSFVLSVSNEIPNTGAATWPLRAGGFSLLATGGYLVYWQRKRLREIKYLVPSLWL